MVTGLISQPTRQEMHSAKVITFDILTGHENLALVTSPSPAANDPRHQGEVNFIFVQQDHFAFPRQLLALSEMGCFGFILFIRAVDAQHRLKDSKIKSMPSSADGFIADQLIPFLNQVFRQVKTSPHLKEFTRISWILIDRFLQRLLTFNILLLEGCPLRGRSSNPFRFSAS